MACGTVARSAPLPCRPPSPSSSLSSVIKILNNYPTVNCVFCCEQRNSIAASMMAHANEAWELMGSSFSAYASVSQSVSQSVSLCPRCVLVREPYEAGRRYGTTEVIRQCTVPSMRHH